VDVNRIKECQTALEEFLTNRKADLLQLIADEKALTDAVVEGLTQAVSDFKSSWK
jgi:F-type H+-transporting ATPase subunit alpha